MNEVPPSAGAERRVLGAAAVASTAGAAGAAWAHFSQETCNACGAATDLFGGSSLVALLGLAGYATILALSLAGLAHVPKAMPADTAPSDGKPSARSPFTVLAAGGLLVAAGVHLALAWLLARNRIACPPCIFTGISALLGAAAVVLLERAWLRRGVVLVGAAFLLTAGAAKVLRPRAEFWEHRAAVRAAQAVLRGIPGGAPHIVAFVRAGCPHCEHYRKDVLPAVLAQHSPPPRAVEVQAPPQLKTPTVVVTGVRSTVFDGCPTAQDLELAWRLATGKASVSERPKMGIPVPQP